MEKYFDPFPENIRHIGVAAPSSVPDKKKIKESLKIAAQLGISVRMGSFLTVPAEEKYFSGSTASRIREMQEFCADETLDMILCARGGYGSSYLLPFLDYAALKKRKTPLIIGGFSDITALHLGLLAKNVPGGVACPMFGSLKEICTHKGTALSMRKALEAFSCFGHLCSGTEEAEPIVECALRKNLQWKKLASLHSYAPGKKFIPVKASPLLPANLTLLTRLCGTEYMPDLTGKVLLVEEVGELPRKVDFSFLQLSLSHILEKCAAVVLGQYTNCGSCRELTRIFMRASAMNGVPFYGFLPFGHGRHTISLVCNELCRIDENGVISLLR